MTLSVDLRRLDLRTRDTFTIARGGSDLWHNLLLSIEQDGITGLGEGAPRGYYGESVEDGMASLRDWIGRRERVTELDIEGLGRSFDGPASARAALDIALHDLWARAEGLALSELLARAYGLRAGPLPCSAFTIGIDALDRMVEKVHHARSFPILKIKLGTRNDLEILRAIRGESEAELRVDANGAWTVDETLSIGDELADLGVTLLEQPLPRDDLAGYAALHGRFPIPVFADESCRDLADVARVAGLVDGINIKLSKCGGLFEAVRMLQAARAADLKVMVGCFIESSVAITAAGALAAFVDALDIDGAALLEEDPFRGLELRGGRLQLPTGPGLGVTERER